VDRDPLRTSAPETQSATGPRVRRRRLTRAVAVKRTIIPFVLTTLAVTGAGRAMQHHAPEARSLG